MELNDLLRDWNFQYGEKFYLAPSILEATYFREPPESRIVVSTAKSVALCKRDAKTLRVHLCLSQNTFNDQLELQRLVNKLDGVARNYSYTNITFGSGDRHLFPGVPLYKDLKNLTAVFKPMGLHVFDFEGDLETLVLQSESQNILGELLPLTTETQTVELKDFIEQEFKGRWAREFNEDLEKHNSRFYFGFYVDKILVGYVRLYGWTTDYVAPGVYFAHPNTKRSGLGPIGIGAKFRGQGYGANLLAHSWRLLKNKGCLKVAVDWTMEKTFYENAGLTQIQRYQPAIRSL